MIKCLEGVVQFFGKIAPTPAPPLGEESNNFVVLGGGLCPAAQNYIKGLLPSPKLGRGESSQTGRGYTGQAGWDFFLSPRANSLRFRREPASRSGFAGGVLNIVTLGGS